jgi:predicted Zn finger-like uncharacterized protein
MILDCPACHARFLVADSAIPAAGRTVRCGKCANQWHVAPPESVALAEAALAALTAADGDATKLPQPPVDEVVKPLAPGANVPALSRRKLHAKPFIIATPLIAATWLVLALIAYFPSWLDAPVASSVYKSMGIKTTQGLVFSDVTMEREQEGSKTRFVIAGSVSNHASDARTVPDVRVTLKDKDGKPIWGREYPVGVEIAAGSVYPFRITNVETSFAGSVASIVLDLGHPLELAMR